MSTCISRAGEYSDHEPGDWCPRCGAFNEEAIVAERDHLRGLAAERLEMVVREQKRYVQDTDALFLARKDAERELRDRELHHFEAEKAMTEALAALDSHEQGEDDRLERIFKAQNILRAALTDQTNGDQR